MSTAVIQQLRSDRDRFISFSFAGADLLIELDAQASIRYLAGAARRFTGMDASTLLGRSFSEIVMPDDRPLLAALLGKLSRSGLRSEPVVIRLGRETARIAAVISGCKLPDMGDGFHFSLSEARLTLANTLKAEHRDEKSGLLVAQEFERRALDCVRIAREFGADLGLTFIELANLDNFAKKAGQASADALISDLGGALRAASLGGNAAGKLDQSRFGVVHAADLSSAELRAEIAELTRKADPAGIIGVESRNLSLPTGQMTAEDAANALAYAVTKFASGGANAFSFASAEDTLKALIAETVARVASFKSTVADNRFSLVYQPIVDLESRKPHHFEVLTRFEGDGSPFETIRFAEGVSLIGDFDLAVCRRSLDVIQERHDLGYPQPLAVNLSGRSIGSDLFIATLQGLLAQCGPWRSNLMFEITESAQIDDLVRAGNIIRAFQEGGNEVSLDDFGAGSASFPYLKALNVNHVKIDGAYVKQARTEQRDRAILKSITSLCNELGIGTIAEMIEDEQQAALMAQIGVGYGQGWCFGKPGPLPELAPALSRTSHAARRRGGVEQWG